MSAKTLKYLIDHFGWTSWEIGLADTQEHDLGNGLSVSGLNLDSFVSADQTTGYRLDETDLRHFTNVSAHHTGQYSSPDCLHDSEYLSGGMLAQYIQPGEYAIAFIDWDCTGEHYLEELPEDFDHSDCESYPEGWLFLVDQRDFYEVRVQWEGALIESSLHDGEDNAMAEFDRLRELPQVTGVTIDVSINREVILASVTTE